MKDWINIQEKRPPEPDTYLILVTIKDGAGGACRSTTVGVFNGNYFYDQSNGQGISNVTHWREIEGPPYEEDEEEIIGVPPSGSRCVEFIRGVDITDFFNKLKSGLK